MMYACMAPLFLVSCFDYWLSLLVPTFEGVVMWLCLSAYRVLRHWLKVCCLRVLDCRCLMDIGMREPVGVYRRRPSD
jgi:hypothetical protein